MRAGKREDRITIQQPTSTKDAIGGYTTSWSTYAIVWADVKPMNGKEAMQYGQTTTDNSYKIELNYDDAPLLNASMRVRNGYGVITIQSVTYHKRNNSIEIIGYQSND